MHNEAKALKEQKEREEKEAEDEREKKRKDRDSHVKRLIKDTKYGGREVPIEQFHRAKSKLSKDEQLQKEKEERKQFQLKAQKNKEEIEKIREKTVEELRQKKEQEQKEAEVKAKLDEKIRRAFMAEQRKKLTQSFEETYKRRDDIILRKESMERLEKENEKRLKDQMEKYIASTKHERGIDKQEQKAIDAFLAEEAVSNVFDANHKQLMHLYTFYASQDTKKDNSFDLEFLHSMMSLQEFVRFGFQQTIVPEFVTPDDMVFIYKSLLSENKDRAQDDKQALLSHTAGMVDYQAFKKAIVRISVMAQEKLGGVNEDLLAKKLE